MGVADWKATASKTTQASSNGKTRASKPLDVGSIPTACADNYRGETYNETYLEFTCLVCKTKQPFLDSQHKTRILQAISVDHALNRGKK